MDLFEKFGAVEVNANDRLNEADKIFCERHQAAYESALTAYTEMLHIPKRLAASQKELVSSAERETYRKYTLSDDDVHVNEYSVERHLKNLQARFLGNVVKYFSNTYAITLNEYEIREKLEQSKPSDETADGNDSEETVKPEPIRYETIIDLIFKEMDGRCFEEYAMFQLREDCKKAVGIGGVCAERRKAAISFRDSYCYASERDRYPYTETEWTLMDNGKVRRRFRPVFADDATRTG